MSVFRKLFGPSKDEIWSQIAGELGGEFIDGGFWGKDALVYQHGEWKFLLDTYTVSDGKNSTTYTRMRAPFVNRDGLYFKIYRENFFSSLGKLFGMQDIEIADSVFDEKFIVKGNDEDKIRWLLHDDRVRDMIREQPKIHLEIKKNEKCFKEEFPDGVDVLYFRCVGVMKKTAHLKALFVLFALALERLVEMDSAYEGGDEFRTNSRTR